MVLAKAKSKVQPTVVQLPSVAPEDEDTDDVVVTASSRSSAGLQLSSSGRVSFAQQVDAPRRSMRVSSRIGSSKKSAAAMSVMRELLADDTLIQFDRVTKSIITLQRLFRLQRASPLELKTRTFFRACQMGDLESVEEALNELGAEECKEFCNTIQEKDPTALCRTGLHLAVAGGHDDVVAVLLENGANPSIPDMQGFQPLHYACMDVKAYVIKAIEASGNSKHKAASWKTEYKLVEQPDTMLDCMALLIRAGADVNCRNKTGGTPLHLSCSAGLRENARLLLKNRADPNLMDNVKRCPIHLAAWAGQRNIVKLLLDHNADHSKKNAVGRTPIHVAATYGHTNTIKVLLDYGAPIDATNHNNNTAFHICLLDGFKRTAEFLYNRGASVTVLNNNLESPLLICVEKYPDLAKKILERKRVSEQGVLFGDMLDVRYDFEGIDDMRCPDTQKYPYEPSNRLTPAGPCSPRKALRPEWRGQMKSPLQRIIDLRHRELILDPVIVKLLELKWKQFARSFFNVDMFVHAFIVTVWTLVSIGWCHGESFHPLDPSRSPWGQTTQVIFEYLMLFAISLALAWEVSKLVSHQTGSPGLLHRLKSQTMWWYHDVLLFFAMVVAVTPTTATSALHGESGYTDTQKMTARVGSSFISLFVWMRWLQFAVALKLSGPFVRIIVKMIKDIGNFLTVATIFVFAFAHSFYVMLVGTIVEEEGEDLGSSSGRRGGAAGGRWDLPEEALLTAFRFMVADFDYEGISSSWNRGWGTVLFCAYIVLAAILLLNLVIAMLNDTYRFVQDESLAEWRLSWAHRILKSQSFLSDRWRYEKAYITSFETSETAEECAIATNTSMAGASSSAVGAGSFESANGQTGKSGSQSSNFGQSADALAIARMLQRFDGVEKRFEDLEKAMERIVEAKTCELSKQISGKGNTQKRASLGAADIPILEQI